MPWTWYMYMYNVIPISLGYLTTWSAVTCTLLISPLPMLPEAFFFSWLNSPSERKGLDCCKLLVNLQFWDLLFTDMVIYWPGIRTGIFDQDRNFTRCIQ